MKVLGVIPARGGSKGVPGKNYKELMGKPLIEFTIRAARESKLDKFIVSTDEEIIINICRQLKVDVPFVRPNDLARDESRSIDVAKHALLEMERIDKTKYDALMLLQPTTPFRRASDINESIDLLTQDEECQSVISVVDVEGNHPARMKFINNGLLVDPIFCEKYENQNRQELEKMYIRNGAIYLTKREVILEGSYKGNKSIGLIMPKMNSINIDNTIDFKFAEFALKENLL